MIGQVQLQMAINHTDSVSHIQQNAAQRGALGNEQAATQMHKQVQRAQETVIPKDALELTQFGYDASKEGRNKYVNLRKKKEKAKDGEEEEKKEELQPRVNFDIEI